MSDHSKEQEVISIAEWPGSPSLPHPDERIARVPLEAILRTEELNKRPKRPPDYESENRALTALVQALADSPRTILQTLAEKVLEVLRAGSSGLSLLTKDEKSFYWAAIAGTWKPHLGGGTPRGFGPCGDVLDRNVPLLFTHWERRYPYLLPAIPLAEEGLLVPFYVGGKAVGTIWAIAHDPSRKFDAEDLRLLESLGWFASAAVESVEALEQRRHALSLMEDAVRARELAQNLNRELRNEITERKQAEEALRRSEAEAHRLLELHQRTITNMGEGMYALDAQGVVTYINPEAERLFGWRSEELLGRRMHDVIHYKRSDGSPLSIEECAGFRVLREGEFLKDFEDAFIRKDGSFFPVSYSSSPLRDHDGKIVGLVIVFQDITERKRGADALREARDLLAKTNEDLETRVAKRTAELVHEITEREKLQAQLLQAQKMESIGVLAGGIAHDFNNILNIIQGYTALLSDGDSDAAETAESVKVINETILRGSAVVQQLLTLARKSEPRLGPTDANHLLDDLMKLLKETFPKIIELKTEQAPELPPVLADPNQVTQALLNLCVNARDAMPSCGTLTLTSQLVDGADLQDRGGKKPGQFVRIEVRDTGTGMDPAVQGRIFEPFFTTKRTGQGTGLGLSVVYGIIQSHNGLIEVDSAPTQGTTFRIYLPAASSAERPIEPNAKKEHVSRKSQTNGRGTILVVEDEAHTLRLLEQLLSRRGYHVLTACDGEEAIEVYRSHREIIDVVLLDLGLPKMDGRHVLLQIKNDKRNVKIVIASGYLEPDLRSEIEQAGVKHFIHKPYVPDDVIKKLQEPFV